MDRIGLICRYLKENPHASQRELAAKTGLSLGTVNTLIKECAAKRLIAQGKSVAGTYELTDLGNDTLERFRVDGALILAAGFGSRFVPLTFETPKGLLDVFGERMIERQIRQLREVGVTDITVAVGYLKEKFEYLTDRYGAKLIYNPEYASKNTLATIYYCRSALEGRNMYILSSDNWLRDNMFHTYECGAWYSSSYMNGKTSEWVLSCNKKGRITDVQVGGEDAWVMYGPAYFSREFSATFLPLVEQAYQTPGTEAFYWEEILREHIDELEMDINRQPADQVYEFENLEELRAFDPKYQNHSDNAALRLVSQVFRAPESEVHEIRCLKSGMTNKSFLFTLRGRSYICRIPGPGTELLINRKQEAAVYDAIRPLNLSEHVIYINGQTGYKIAEYYEGARNADPESREDMEICMSLARRLHTSGLTVRHRFDIRERIDFYESLCKAHGGTRFEDYETIRAQMDELMEQLEQLGRPEVLSHIDVVADNVLILPDGSSRLIDWEYAGMCDPLIDIAMCAIYSYYSEEKVEDLMELYFQRSPTAEERFVVYSYIALGGFLWSLWAVYKSSLGEEFGEYTMIMYRYARNYYKKIKNLPFSIH
ncbi:MAG: phosphotransferase [Clostridiales bacterium]|nr:phosphotransferase [Clostridiales bacterium]